VSSCQNTQGTAGDPINTRTGGFDYSTVDMSIPTVSGPLLFQRNYSTQATELYTSTLGYGWTHNHDTRLIFPNDPGGEADIVWFKAHTTNQYRFDISAPDTFTPYPGVLASLTGDETNGYTLVDESQDEYLFDGDGKLLSWSNPQGHTFTYTYTNGLLSRVSDPSGQRYLDFHYTAGRLDGVSDHAGRAVSFGYTGDNLTSFTDVLDQPWLYSYNDPNYPHHLTEVIDPRLETAVRVEYDAQGRAETQYDGKDQAVVSLTYNSDGTTIIEDGNAYTTTHTYDARNTLVGVSDPLNNEIEKSYAYSFRPASVTDPNDHTTALSWSMDGTNLLGATDADGKSLEMAYDDLNNLTSLVDRRGFETTFTYTGTLLVSRSDALEHTTYYTYTTAADFPQPPGLLKKTVAPLDDVSNQTTGIGYDAFGQATVITDTLGYTTHYSYDALGRLETQTDALGRDTQYDYDLAGRLLKLTRNYDPARPQNDQDLYNIVTEYGTTKWAT
jgi:YD repeat-containing protein